MLVSATSTLPVAGSQCGAHKHDKQGEWRIIGKTLFPSTHWCFIHRKYPQIFAIHNMESSTSRVTTEYELKRYSYDRDHQGILCPRTVPSDTLVASLDILRLSYYICKSFRCRTAGCCSKLGRTIFCLWEGGEARNNSLIRNQLEDEESDYTTEEPHEDTDATL